MARIANTQVTKAALAQLAGQNPGLTRQALGLTNHYIQRMLADGDIAIATDRKGETIVQKVVDGEGKPQRGHPHLVYKATKSGAAKGRRFLKSQTQEA